MQTTIQDLAADRACGTSAYRPPGAVDELTFALLNAAVGNPESAAGLECVVSRARR